MKAKKYYILAPIIVIALILSGCDSDTPKKTAQKKYETPEEVKRLCSQYNAVTDWKQHFHKKAFGQHTYTVEVEDALIRTDGRPILFYGVADDIVKESDKYVVYWSAGFASLLRGSDTILDLAFDRDVRFVLDCTPSQVEKIMDNSVSTFDDYAVIARISEVEKIRFKLSSGENGEKVRVETSDVFMAKGKCLDLLFVVGEPKNEQKNN